MQNGAQLEKISTIQSLWPSNIQAVWSRGLKANYELHTRVLLPSSSFTWIDQELRLYRGLFETSNLNLQYSKSLNRPSTGKVVLIWGGSTSVGSNAIQLAVAAGHEVVSTASPRNFDCVKSLGASAVFDSNKE